MEIIKAKDIGFCFGVRRAIKRAENAITHLPANDLYMLGEIIHNPQVIREFRIRGINIIQEISQVPSNKYLIIRAHGIVKREEDYAKRNNIILIDTICPYVKKLHQIANSLQREGYQIIILGDINHPEIRSLLSYIDHKAYVVQSINDIKCKSFEFSKKIGLLSQTTKDLKQLHKIIKIMFNYTEELRIFNTICKATRLRQQATRDLAKIVDLMIVIGGLNSANTQRLAYLSKAVGVETYHIEDEKQLNINYLRDKGKIGITSGTSTPDYVTEKIIKKIRELNHNN
ncbi:MAG: 4-hydroxy-3-methylbut-2-enyl diphosphate reductase [Atribacterota bacterium]|jgi:4-hydroxy-3-methylbut-2-enyl diphosphate reductase|nr:4-hydroxy-3-methylbut-2-enyl diphosphate reductase [Atribacterota bacterium]MDD4896652.1 4-hydroxy-3-methylbut-2-enyl diphosphate reductase [Atribacterota bacterium]MDD5637679.1 4-hydroxy-3-methylbut-2-enyl diphosphate reductase [Atribacterota bacterium]